MVSTGPESTLAFLLAMRLEAGMEFLRGLLVPFLLLLFLPDFLLMTLSSQAICE